MSQQKGGPAGFFAVLLGRSTNDPEQAAAKPIGSDLGRNTDQLSNQLTAVPASRSATVRIQPPQRVSGQTAFEAAVNNASSSTSRDRTSQLVPQNVPDRRGFTKNALAATAMPSQNTTTDERPIRRVSFKSPKSSLRDSNGEARADTGTRAKPVDRMSTPSAETRISSDRHSSQQRTKKYETSQAPRPDRKILPGTSYDKTRPNGIAAYKPTQQPVQSRDDVGYRAARTPANEPSRNSTLDRPQKSMLHQGQQTQQDSFEPVPRRPVPSFLPPVASTAGKFDKIEEPKVRSRPPYRRTPSSNESKVRQNDEQNRRSVHKTASAETRSIKARDAANSRSRVSPTRRTAEQYYERDGARAQQQRPAAARPTQFSNNVGRNPLSSYQEDRPTGSRSRG